MVPLVLNIFIEKNLDPGRTRTCNPPALCHTCWSRLAGMLASWCVVFAHTHLFALALHRATWHVVVFLANPNHARIRMPSYGRCCRKSILGLIAQLVRAYSQ